MGAVIPYTALSAATATVFTYTVNFYSTEGAPTVALVYIDGTPHELQLSTGQPDHGTYRFVTELGGGAITITTSILSTAAIGWPARRRGVRSISRVPSAHCTCRPWQSRKRIRRMVGEMVHLASAGIMAARRPRYPGGTDFLFCGLL